MLLSAGAVVAITGSIGSAFASNPECEHVSPPISKPESGPVGRDADVDAFWSEFRVLTFFFKDGPPFGRAVGRPLSRPVGPPCPPLSPPVSPSISRPVGPPLSRPVGPPPGHGHGHGHDHGHGHGGQRSGDEHS